MIIVPKNNLYLPRRLWPGDKAKQRGSIIMATSGVYPVADYIVNLGADRAETGADVPVYDARAGFRFVGSSKITQDGHNPNNGGPIDPWEENRNPISPFGYTISDFEISWTEIQQDGISERISPFAADTFTDWTGIHEWYARQTSGPSGILHWIIDITLREKADTGNTDTMRMDMNVEAV